LREIDAALRGGVDAVNLCTAAGLDEELFSYAGSGTLFTETRYVDVRPLGIDDFPAASDLFARGVAEGFLALRSEPEVDRVLANGYGAFVERSHLAGIGALVPHPESGTGEIASLYTLTRFLGEGIGGHIVSALCQVARERGLCARVRVHHQRARRGLLRAQRLRARRRGRDPRREVARLRSRAPRARALPAARSYVESP
jgi:GNAT superfamily N-acetyltransferase